MDDVVIGQGGVLAGGVGPPGARIVTRGGLMPGAQFTGLPPTPLEKDLVFSLTQQSIDAYSRMGSLVYPFLSGPAVADLTTLSDGGVWVYHNLEGFPPGRTIIGWLATLEGVGVNDVELDSLLFGTPPSTFMSGDLSVSVGPMPASPGGSLSRGGPTDDWGAGPVATDDLNALPDFGLFWNFSSHGTGTASISLRKVTLRYFLAP